MIRNMDRGDIGQGGDLWCDSVAQVARMFMWADFLGCACMINGRLLTVWHA